MNTRTQITVCALVGVCASLSAWAEPDELAKLREAFEQRMTLLEVQSADASLAGSPADYLRRLQALQKGYQSMGELEAYQAAGAEAKRFRLAGVVADGDLLAAPPELRQLQETVREAQRRTAEQATALRKAYVGRLADLKRELTMAGRIDDAVAVKAEADRVAGVLARRPAATPAAPGLGTPAVPAAPVAVQERRVTRLPCEHCGGTGKLRTPCPNRACQGGQIEYKGLGDRAVVRKPCPVCGGRGFTKETPCPVCGGRGWTAKTEIVTVYRSPEPEAAVEPPPFPPPAPGDVFEGPAPADPRPRAPVVLPPLPTTPPAAVQTRPRPADLDFAAVQEQLREYLAKQPADVRAMEVARIRRIAQFRPQLLKYMKYLPYGDRTTYIKLQDGRRERGSVSMSNENYLSVRQGSARHPRFKRVDWEELDFAQYIDFFEFYIAKRLDQQAKRDAAEDYDRLALICEWYDHPEEAARYAARALECDPQIGGETKALLYYLNAEQ